MLSQKKQRATHLVSRCHIVGSENKDTVWGRRGWLRLLKVAHVRWVQSGGLSRTTETMRIQKHGFYRIHNSFFLAQYMKALFTFWNSRSDSLISPLCRFINAAVPHVQVPHSQHRVCTCRDSRLCGRHHQRLQTVLRLSETFHEDGVFAELIPLLRRVG